MTSLINSPCINICRLRKGVCVGCFRIVKEINDWWEASDDQKLKILANCKERKQHFEEK